MVMILLYFLLFASLYLFITNKLVYKIKNLPPSPFPAIPIIGHLHLLKMPLHRTFSKLSIKLGPIFLLQLGSRRVVVVSSPPLVSEFLTTNDVVFANRPLLLAGKHLGYNFSTLTWTPYSDHWRNLRRIFNLELFTSNRLQLLAGLRSEEVRSMIRRILDHVDEPVNMKSAFFEVTLNVIMRMVADLNVTDRVKLQGIVEETFRLGGVNIGDFLPALKWIGVTGLEDRLIALQKKRDEFVQEMLEECRRIRNENSSSGETKKTLIDFLLPFQESEPDYYTDDIVKGLMLVPVTAGTDTSAGTMEWALSLLLNNPEVLKKGQAEINDVVGNTRLIEESDLPALPYLHCIINETLRMYPAGPLLVPHESSAESRVGGFCIPTGTMLLVNMWGIQNDPLIWEEPRKFKPERFQGMDGMGDRYRFMPFGSGRRSCPGEGLAFRMVGLVLGSLIQCFDWGRVGTQLVDMTEGPGLTMPKAQPLIAKCKLHPAMVSLVAQI